MSKKLRLKLTLVFGLISIVMSSLIVSSLWIGPTTQDDEEAMRDFAEQAVKEIYLEKKIPKDDAGYIVSIENMNYNPILRIENEDLILLVYNKDIDDYRFIYRREIINLMLTVFFSAFAILLNYGIYKGIQKIYIRVKCNG